MRNISDKFVALRDMESFTEEMFNQIIAFQERQHPAWNKDLPFDDRIKALPLHYLVFSNADRNLATHGPSVAHYYPLREEFEKIIHYAKQVADTPVICDLHARNGFIGSLLAREGGDKVNVIGLINPDEKPNQIESFYDNECYKYYDADRDQLGYDVAFSSWMPSGKNLTEEILKKDPKLIIYIYTDHTDKETGERQTGTDESFTQLPKQYQLIDTWTVRRPKDLFHEIWPDLTPSHEEQRHVRVYARTPYQTITPYKATAPNTPYDWEKELQMALLALEAKQLVRNL